MAWKMVLMMVGVVGNLIVVLLDYKWHDKRTREFKRGRSALVYFVFPVLLILGAVAVAIDDDQHAKESATIKAEFASLAKRAEAEAGLAAKRADEQRTQIATLSSDNEKLRALLAPILVEVRRLHPKAAESEIMSEVRSRLLKLAGRVESETPSGVVNGVNAVFHTSSVPAGDVQLFVDRLRQVAGVDYELSGTTITFKPGSVPPPEAIVRIDYSLPR
jgi:hypothetical protein